MNRRARLLIFGLTLGLAGCSPSPPTTTTAPPTSPEPATSTSPATDHPAPNPENNVYFGDVHVHTGWSFDALTNGSKTTPMDAYA